MVFEFLMFKFGVRALIGGLIVAVTCASLGVFIVLRRLSLIADGLGHVAFGGIALGFWTGLYPLYTAVASVVAGALGIHVLGQLGLPPMRQLPSCSRQVLPSALSLSAWRSPPRPPPRTCSGPSLGSMTAMSTSLPASG